VIVKIQDRAKKDLKKLDKQEAIHLLNTIKKLEHYPKITNIKKLKNYYPPFRYRVGDYRILFDVEDDELIVFGVKHRQSAYK
jgi:mRNA interferase RelE/StbE